MKGFVSEGDIVVHLVHIVFFNRPRIKLRTLLFGRPRRCENGFLCLLVVLLLLFLGEMLGVPCGGGD